MELESGKQAGRSLESGKQARRSLESGKGHGERSELENGERHSPLQVEAKTVELALVRASAALGVPQDEIGYRLVRQDKGIASLFSRKRVELEVWRRTEVESADDLNPETEREVVAELQDYCRAICSRILGTEAVVTAQRAGQRLVIDIDDDWLLSSVQRYPKIIESLEHLLRKKPRHLRRGLPFRIFVDVKQHRVTREASLVQQAKELAARVIADQRPLTMSCRGAHERRAIHLALDNDRRIRTKSIGRGFERKLMILPASISAQE